MTMPPLFSSPLLEAIHHQHEALIAGQRDSNRLLHTIVTIGDRIMATLADLTAAIAEEKAARIAQESRATAALALLQKTIDDLASNPSIPDSVVASIKAEQAALEADFPAPPAPAPVVASGEQQIPQ